MGASYALCSKRIRSKKAQAPISKFIRNPAKKSLHNKCYNPSSPGDGGAVWPRALPVNRINLGKFWTQLPRDCTQSAKEIVSLKVEMVIHKLPIGGNNNHKLSRLDTTGPATLQMNFSHSYLGFITLRRKRRNTATGERLERKSKVTLVIINNITRDLFQK